MLRALRGLQLGLVLTLCLTLVFGCQWIFGDVDITRQETSPALCSSGEFRCNGEYLLSCVGEAGWKLSDVCTTADRCDSRKETCTQCKQGDYRCEGAAWQTCNEDGTGWTKLRDCESAELCSPSGCGPCTSPGELQCSGSSKQELRICGTDGFWKIKDTCATESLCARSIDRARVDPAWPGTCEEPVCSDPERFYCEGPRLRRCLRDQTGWEEVLCASEALCALRAAEANAGADGGGALVDMCKEVCSTPGRFRCEGMTLQRCQDDLAAWADVKTCEAGMECNPIQGECAPPCTPGEYQCNDTELRRCQDNRTWTVVERCATAALCGIAADGTGSCRAPVCPVAGDFRCDGAALLECSAALDAWEPRGVCASAALCNAASKRCDTPTCPVPGELRCFEQEIKQCNPDQTEWVIPAGRTQPWICQAGQICDNDPVNPGCKTACPSATRCNGAVLQRCTPDQGWITQATCATNDLCTCALDPDQGGPLTNTCALGVGENGCGVPVCGGNVGPGFRCQGSTLQSCQAGRNGWNVVQDCGSAALCYPGAAPAFSGGYCALCPLAGEVDCEGTSPSTLRTCAANRRSWTTTQTCAGDCIDSGTADYCALCSPGQAQCSAATLQRCANDRRSWNNTVCASAALCDWRNSQCDVCAAGSVTCVSQELRRCSADGQRMETLPCAVCDAAGNQCDACAANTRSCSGANVLQCSADGQMLSIVDTCATTALCTAGACTAPTCNVGQRRCTAAGQPQVCNDGRTAYVNDGMPCVTPELCSAGNCMPPACVPNQRSCIGPQPAICNAGQTQFTPTMDAPCATAALCSNGMCTPPTCQPMQTSCTGAQPVVCNADQNDWDPVGAPCGSAALCNPMTGTCRTCVPNSRRCASGGQPQVCNAAGSAWVDDGDRCVPASLCDDATGSCLSCTPGARRCSGNQPQECNASGRNWVADGDACGPNLCDNASGTCMVCVPESRRCSGSQPQQCNAAGSAWVNDGMACGPGLCNSPTGACLTCAPDSRRCNAGQPEICNSAGSAWVVNGPACVPASLCDNATGTCSTCTANAYRCSVDALERCLADGSAWMLVQACDPGLCDATGRECDDCVPPTAPTCSGNSVRTCGANGRWSDMDCGTDVCVSGACTPPTMNAP